MSEPSVVDRIVTACDFILRHQNSDGGIPAVGCSDGSGCWTSAAMLEALVTQPFFRPDISKIEKLTQFFITEQHSTQKKLFGSWALTAGGRQGSTLATAHALIALDKAMAFPGLNIDLTGAINSAKQWLVGVQNDDGGWGVEPYGGKAGAESRTVATYMALRALGACGESVESSRAARLGANWVFSVYNSSGGFKASKTATVDPCSTARACLAINSVGALDERPDLLNDVISYIVNSKPLDKLWELSQESYVPDGAAGQIFFHQNTTAELLGFLSDIKLLPMHQLELLNWFKNNQNDDGSWYLGANNEKHTEIIMWSTADAILSLESFIRSWDFSYIPAPLKVPWPWQKRLFWLMTSIAIVEFLLIVGLPSLVLGVIAESWQNLPEDFKVSFIWAFVFGVFASIVAAGIGTGIAHFLKKKKQ